LGGALARGVAALRCKVSPRPAAHGRCPRCGPSMFGARPWAEAAAIQPAGGPWTRSAIGPAADRTSARRARPSSRAG